MIRPCGNCGKMTCEQELHLDKSCCNEPVCPSCVGVYGDFETQNVVEQKLEKENG